MLYKNGLYVVTIAAEINNIDKKNLTERYMNLPIKNINEIAISGSEICEVLNIKPSKLIKDILFDLERRIILGKLINDKKNIVQYIKIKYINN